MKWTDDKLERKKGRNMKDIYTHWTSRIWKTFSTCFHFLFSRCCCNIKLTIKWRQQSYQLLHIETSAPRVRERGREQKSMSEWENSIFWTAVIKCYYRQPISVHAFELSSLNCSGNFVERNVFKFISRLRTKLN